jgi:hypothetical protein
MRSFHVAIAALAIGMACASVPDPELEPVGPRGDSKMLTAADLANATQLNLLEFIAAERPQWLRTPDGRPSAVSVYIGDTRLGGPSTLKELTLATVATVRYFEVTAAQQRFNLRDRGPVIQVVTR